MVRINGIEVKKCSQCPYFFDFETYFRLPAKEKGYGYPEGYNAIGCKQVFSLCPLRNYDCTERSIH